MAHDNSNTLIHILIALLKYYMYLLTVVFVSKPISNQVDTELMKAPIKTSNHYFMKMSCKNIKKVVIMILNIILNRYDSQDKKVFIESRLK